MEYSCAHKHNMYHINLFEYPLIFSIYPGICKAVDQVESEDKGMKIQRQAVGGLKLIVMCILQRMMQTCMEFCQKFTAYYYMVFTPIILFAYFSDTNGLSFLASLTASLSGSSPLSDLQDHSCFSQLKPLKLRQ